MKCTRQQFYVTVCVILSTALCTLSPQSFRLLAASVHEYLSRLEEECG